MESNKKVEGIGLDTGGEAPSAILETSFLLSPLLHSIT
jgi:hypothetical protein